MDNLYIIKIGGNIIDNEDKLHMFLNYFASITEKKILIHGGGKLATQLAEKMGIPQQMIDGRRITSQETLNLVTMVYAGLINKKIVAILQQSGCNAFGMCGADGNSILAHKRVHASVDYGYAGDIDKVNVSLLNKLIEIGLIPVMAPITHDKIGQLLNTNADSIAREIATSLSVSYKTHLIYLFEKKGVLLNEKDDNSLIKNINSDYYKQLKEEKIIFAGMLPKLDNAFSALKNGVSEVMIGNAEDLPDLLEGRTGTTITNEK